MLAYIKTQMEKWEKENEKEVVDTMIASLIIERYNLDARADSHMLKRNFIYHLKKFYEE